MDIRLIRPSQVREAGRHVLRHTSESGHDGDIVFAPFTDFDREVFEAARYETWRRSIDEPGWERFWGAFDGDRIIGHLELTGGSMSSTLHRARLGTGVERAYRGKGIGDALLSTALDWARHEKTLRWVELSVFAHNQVARALYANHGFVDVGVVPDAYEVLGKRIDDVWMVLSLR